MAKPTSEIAALERWAGKVLGEKVGAEPLSGDGGGRRYYRLHDTGLLVLAGPDPAENLAWLRIGRHLWFKGLPLPRIVDHDLSAGLFLLEDLGDRLLAGLDDDDLYYQAVELAARIHTEGPAGFEPLWCHQTRRYSAVMAEQAEISYFLKHLVLGYLKWPRLPRGIKIEVKALAEAAAACCGRGDPVLMHRDYQGRNLIDFQGRLHLLDWQGARSGPAVYDLSSLMEETPGRRLEDAFKERLLRHYLKTRGLSRQLTAYQRELYLVGPVRMMQALGAYGRLSLQGKGKFAAYIPPALKRLSEMMRPNALKSFPLLKGLVEEAAEQAQDACLGRAG